MFPFFISYSITKPISKLIDAAIEIGKGKLDTKIEIKSKDEIGELASSFQQMTSELKESQFKLKKYATNLEKTVKQRTEQLDVKLDESEKTKAATVNMMDDLSETLTKLKELDKMKLAFLSSISCFMPLDSIWCLPKNAGTSQTPFPER